jgi:hypothetical protein
LCADSTGENETGKPVEWTNKIELKYEFYSNNEGKRMMRLESVPTGVETRYTTDGSSPLENGALYEGDFEIPEGTQFVLAIGFSKKHDVYSNELSVRVPTGRGPGGIIIDKSKPLVLSKRQRSDDSQKTHELINSLKNHEVTISDIAAVVYQGNERWIELTTDPETRIDPSTLEDQLEKLRNILTEEDSTGVRLEFGYAYFPTGQHFLNWVEDNRLDLQKFSESEVTQ